MKIPIPNIFKRNSVSSTEAPELGASVVLEGVNNFGVTTEDISSYEQNLQRNRAAQKSRECGAVDVQHYRKKLPLSMDFVSDHALICAVIIQRCMRRGIFPSLSEEFAYLSENDTQLAKLLASANWFEIGSQIRQTNIRLGHSEKIDVIAIIRALPYLHGQAQLAQLDLLTDLDEPEAEHDEEGGKAPAPSPADADPDESDQDSNIPKF